jgi:hypothetical protein
MANTVNVTTANTFEQWRVKTNEIGTKIGDLDEVTNSDIGATTIVAALKAHQGIVAGSVTTSGATMTGSMIFNDNAKVILGTSSDGLEIYHDGSHSYIADTGTGNLKFTAPTAEFSANVDVAGTLSLNGTAIGESIADTVGAMVGSNTETGIAVTYNDSDNTLDFVLGTSQTSITSLKNAALAIGRDADNEINFATDNNIIFRAAGANELKLVTAALHPITDSDLDLGTTALRFKDTFTDSITVTGAVTADSLDIEGNVDINGTLEADAITVGGVTLNSTIGVAVGAMVSSNTESGITVAYQASDNTLDFDVNDPTIELTGAVTGQGTMTNLGNVTIATTSGVANVVEADIANDAVSRAKLKDEVSLLIVNAAGSTVKTIFGAGS